MQVVNGYVCANCTDVANAKRGVDPAHAKDPPPEAKRADAAQAAQKERAAFGPAVTFGGSITPPDTGQSVRPVGAETGTRFSITA